ncbi:cubilin-like [Lineus longissimus]|uniref:cubilin-like n=1 Tax=Lineus longissimus TaxID=88925 RepID=UPI002B4DDEA9
MMPSRDVPIIWIYYTYLFVLVLDSAVIHVSGAACFQSVKSDEILTSEGFPSSFPLKVCHYEVMVEPRDTKAVYIVAIFDTFEINDGDTEQKPLKKINKIQIHDVLDENIGTYTDSVPRGTVAKINEDRSKPSLKIIFTAIHQTAGLKIFKMHFQLMTTQDLVPRTSFQDIRGTIVSPGYPFNYPNSYQEIYRVTTNNSNGVLKFNFVDISLGEGTTLAVYDGNKIASENLVYRFPVDHEARTNWNYFVSTNTMTLLFLSAPEDTDRGFNMTYVENCEYNDIDTPCDEVPQLNFVKNLIIIGAGCGGVLLLVFFIGLICLCSRKCDERRQRNMQGMQRFD